MGFENFFKRKKQTKVFGIGFNKTGTTSLTKAMRELDYKIGDQRKAELLHHHWAKRNFKPIIDYCNTAEFFQDIPFSKPFTYVALDQAFTDSKFILTIRDNPEQWYNSLVNFHTKLWSENDKPPTVENLKNADYVYKGWAWEVIKYSSNFNLNDPYNKIDLINSYIEHNNNVMNYFKNNIDKLLIINVKEKDAYSKLCNFLGKPRKNKDFPHENKA